MPLQTQYFVSTTIPSRNLSVEPTTAGIEAHVPARVNRLARRALPQLLPRRGAGRHEVVGAGRRDDAVPDDGLVGLVGGRGARLGYDGPFGRYVDKDLLRVPREQRRQVCVERELDDGILLLLAAVVVGAALDSVRVVLVSSGTLSYRGGKGELGVGKEKALEGARTLGRSWS